MNKRSARLSKQSTLIYNLLPVAACGLSMLLILILILVLTLGHHMIAKWARLNPAEQAHLHSFSCSTHYASSSPASARVSDFIAIKLIAPDRQKVTKGNSNSNRLSSATGLTCAHISTRLFQNQLEPWEGRVDANRWKQAQTFPSKLSSKHLQT